jgi:hypothetical protein
VDGRGTRAVKRSMSRGSARLVRSWSGRGAVVMLVADKRALAFFFFEGKRALAFVGVEKIADEVEPAAGDTDARVNHRRETGSFKFTLTRRARFTYHPIPEHFTSPYLTRLGLPGDPIQRLQNWDSEQGLAAWSVVSLNEVYACMHGQMFPL